MKFRFNITLTDEDYLYYNTFWLIRSPYGKKQILNSRIIITIIIGIGVLFILSSSNFSSEKLLNVVPMLILLVIMQLFLVRYFTFSLKAQLKSMKKTGKMAYSPVSVVEFYDDYFVEITAETKTEQRYSSIERVSFVDNKYAYIHLNNVMSCILPLSCFESKEQYDCFFSFIKTKCANFEVYTI